VQSEQVRPEVPVPVQEEMYWVDGHEEQDVHVRPEVPEPVQEEMYWPDGHEEHEEHEPKLQYWLDKQPLHTWVAQS